MKFKDEKMQTLFQKLLHAFGEYYYKLEEGFDSSNASRLSDKAGKEFIAYVEKKIEEKK